MGPFFVSTVLHSTHPHHGLLTVLNHNFRTFNKKNCRNRCKLVAVAFCDIIFVLWWITSSAGTLHFFFLQIKCPNRRGAEFLSHRTKNFQLLNLIRKTKNTGSFNCLIRRNLKLRKSYITRGGLKKNFELIKTSTVVQVMNWEIKVRVLPASFER